MNATPLATLSAFVSLLLAGAVFGFFFAWVCSTMWGLDATDPRVAIQAMQAMNDSVRNAVFFPAFFLTPVALAVSAILWWADGARLPAALAAAAALVYVVGALVVTLAVNVPMNEELARVVVPAAEAEAGVVWQEYSSRWQAFNLVRTVASGGALALLGAGLLTWVR